MFSVENKHTIVFLIVMSLLHPLSNSIFLVHYSIFEKLVGEWKSLLWSCLFTEKSNKIATQGEKMSCFSSMRKLRGRKKSWHRDGQNEVKWQAFFIYLLERLLLTIGRPDVCIRRQCLLDVPKSHTLWLCNFNSQHMISTNSMYVLLQRGSLLQSFRRPDFLLKRPTKTLTVEWYFWQLHSDCVVKKTVCISFVPCLGRLLQ